MAGPDSEDSGNLAGRRVKLLHAVLLAVAAAAAGAWLAGTRIESPADVAARSPHPRRRRSWSRSRNAS